MLHMHQTPLTAPSKTRKVFVSFHH